MTTQNYTTAKPNWEGHFNERIVIDRESKSGIPNMIYPKISAAMGKRVRTPGQDWNLKKCHQNIRIFAIFFEPITTARLQMRIERNGVRS